MQALPMWQVDAFTSRPFGGNPACVVALERWLDETTLQAIAAENNLSETAFLVPEGGEYAIRWFTPTLEVNLCGHATLASAHVVFNHLSPGRQRVSFASKSGRLHVSLDRGSGRITLDFPAYDCRPAETTPELVAALDGARPAETWLGVKLMAVFERESQVRALAPDFAKVASLPGFGLIATAPGDACDFVSRYFVPQAGVNEDPVTGAAHCQLTPWWAKRLGRARLTARQVSRRGGELWVEHAPPRVLLAGHAVEYMRATIQL
jgi:PhzF family phenazine biosynthesis protein